jgi:hypothetical protein
MISKDCKFSDFVSAVQDKSYYELLRLADREATEAERLFLRSKTDPATRQRCGREYAERIKHLIDYMRFEVKPRRRRSRDAETLAGLNPKRPLRRGL